MVFAEQSVATNFLLGPFLDSTDGVTAETALDVTTMTCMLFKGVTASFLTLSTSAGVNDCVHTTGGYFNLELAGSNLSAIGRNRVAISVAGALPVWQDIEVEIANYFQARHGMDRLQVDTRELGDSTLALTTQMQTDAQDKASSALAAYDPPTRTEATTDKDAIITEVDANEAKIDIITVEAAAISAKTTNLPADPADDSDIDAQLATITTNLNAVKDKTSSLAYTAGSIKAHVTAEDNIDFGVTKKASINTEVVDSISVDDHTEPGDMVPPVTTSLLGKVGFLYKDWRNKSEQTSNLYSLYNDAGTNIDQQASVSDDGTTFTKGEVGAGP